MSKALINLMPTTSIAIRDGWIAEEQLVRFSPSPNDGDIYKCGGEYRGGVWVDLYAPARKGLDKLQIAGNIGDVVAECHTERIESRIWQGTWSGIYMTPAGFPIPLSDEYEFDVSIGGTRWEERVEIEYESLLADKSNAKRLNKEGRENVEVTLSDEEKQAFRERAEGRATRYCKQAAQYGLQRARTGARLRGLRTYFQIGRYTLEQIQSSEFRIVRVRRDREHLASQVGETSAQLLMLAEAAQESNLPAEVIAGLIEAARQPQMPAPIIEGDFAEEPEVETKETRQAVSSESEFFNIPANKDTISNLKRLIRTVSDAGAMSDTAASKKISKVFPDTNVNTLSAGHAQLLITLYSKLADLKEKGANHQELAQEAQELMAIARKYALHKHLWQEQETENDGTDETEK